MTSQRDRRTIAEPDAWPPTPYPRCQLCGAPHTPEEPILCVRCGEPVLLWGWAP